MDPSVSLVPERAKSWRMGRDGLGPDFGAILIPQIHGSLSIFGSGAGKVVDVFMTGGGWSGSTGHEAKIDAL